MLRSHIRRYPPPGRTWCVDATNGNDAWCGSADNPIQTIAKVNALALKPGDRVLFKRGETWANSKLIPNNALGRPGRHILYGAYGPGAAPIINAAAGATHAVYTNAGRFFTIDGLDLRGGTQHTVQFETAHDIVLQNCNVQDGAGDCILFYGPAATYYNLIIDNCVVHGAVAGNGGIEIGASAAPGPTNILIRGCTVYNNGDTVNSDHGIYLTRVCNATVVGNVCYSNTFGAGIKVRTDVLNVLVNGNRGYGNLYGVLMGPFVAGSNVVVSNNLLYLNTAHGISLDTGTTYASFFHNTLVNNGNGDGEYGLVLNNADCLNNIFKNCLIVQDAAVVGNLKNQPVRCASAANITGNTWDNNCYVFTGGTGGCVANVAGTGKTMAEWQAYGAAVDPHGVNADPVFVTNYTDLHLQTTSPCKNAGATDLGVLADYGEVLRDATPDIGAYEFTP
ncbi:MAG: right-handed parallel beta-helix repeat-containing protein [Planctomycetota bacterium]